MARVWRVDEDAEKRLEKNVGGAVTLAALRE
jgi:hypothetical protein